MSDVLRRDLAARRDRGEALASRIFGIDAADDTGDDAEIEAEPNAKGSDQ